MTLTRYHADCQDCSYVRVGINPEPVRNAGENHEGATGHLVNLWVSGEDRDHSEAEREKEREAFETYDGDRIPR